jgi:hypothetical protein
LFIDPLPEGSHVAKFTTGGPSRRETKVGDGLPITSCLAGAGGLSRSPMMAATTTRSFPVRDYDLAATLAGGQAFRWQQAGALPAGTANAWP